MINSVFPTKGNLISTKKSLALSKLGYDLLDKKRNVLVKEMLSLVEKAKIIRSEIEQTYIKAYSALEKSNITLGISSDISQSIGIENGLEIHYRSVMGVDIPEVYFKSTLNDPNYSLLTSNSLFDMAYIHFNQAKELTAVLSEIDNSIYRLANAISKTQRRANALYNINIPQFMEIVKHISNALEEKEREDFTRLKIIRRKKDAE